MPDILYPILSALLWACSVPIISLGIKKIPQEITLPGIYAGLLTSLLTGTLALSLALIISGEQFSLLSKDWNWYQILAGIFTFPIGTGFYYLCGYGFGGKMDSAAQFTKVKPILSALLAFTVLSEPLPELILLPCIMICAGILLLLKVDSHRKFRLEAVIIGLFTAIAWSIGELFVKLGFSGEASIKHTFYALTSGSLISILVLAPYLFQRLQTLRSYLSFAWPFAIHGVLSFAIAYTLFFHSIALIGLGKTVLINAFWPMLSILISHFFVGRKNGEQLNIKLLSASILLLIGSLSVVFL